MLNPSYTKLVAILSVAMYIPVLCNLIQCLLSHCLLASRTTHFNWYVIMTVANYCDSGLTGLLLIAIITHGIGLCMSHRY